MTEQKDKFCVVLCSCEEFHLYTLCSKNNLCYYVEPIKLYEYAWINLSCTGI